MRYKYVTLCTDNDKFNKAGGSVIKVKAYDGYIKALASLPADGVIQGYTRLKRAKKNKLRHIDKRYDLYANKGIWFKENAYLPLSDEHMYVCIKSFTLRPLIIFLLSLLLLLLLARCSLNKTYTKSFEPEIETRAETVVSKKQKVNEIKIKGFTSMAVSKKTGKAIVILENPKENSCYFVFSVYLNPGHLLYKSKMLPPGRQIREIQFNELLPEGEHKGYVLIDTYAMDSGQALNKGKFNITIKSR